MARARRRPRDEVQVEGRAQSQMSRAKSEESGIFFRDGGRGLSASSGMMVNPPPCSTMPRTAVSVSTDMVWWGFQFCAARIAGTLSEQRSCQRMRRSFDGAKRVGRRALRTAM